MTVSRYYRADSVKTYLNAEVSTSATKITINSAANFPTSYPFTVIINRDATNEEIVQVDSIDSVAGDLTTYNVTRGSSVEPTMTTKLHNVGSSVEHGVSARDFRESREHENATSGVHGVTGSVVGTTDTQNIYNKTISTSTLVNPGFSGSLALPSTTTIGTVTATEISRLSGVTSGIQSQLNGKQATITGAASTITSYYLDGSRALVSNAGGEVAASSITSLELASLSGVASNVQAQIDSKQPTSAILVGVDLLGSSTGIVVKTGASSFATRSVTAGPGISVSTADGVAGNINISSTIQTGLKSVSYTSGSGSATVTSATTTASSAILLTSTDVNMNVAVTSVGTNTFTISVKTIDGASSSSSVNVRWIVL